jgi:glutathione synthase
MKIGFVVNQIETEEPGFTTTRLAMAAVGRGHESFTFGVGDFIYAKDGSIQALARQAPNSGKRSQSLKKLSREKFLEAMQDEESKPSRISVDELDVLVLRNDPSIDAIERPWAQAAPILFGQLAVGRGVLVLNDPEHLATAINKTYFQHFPEEVRPSTCISRSREEIKQFLASNGEKMVIKPLQGSGGNNVFVVDRKDQANVNQMIDAVIRDGYCIAQEYLPAAADGDVRLFVMNGRPLEQDGKVAAFRRVNHTGDARSNMHSGGKSEPVEVTDEMRRIVEIVGPKLVRDGMFLVGLDIVGDKLMEINVFSPGGLGSASEFTGVDFADLVIADLERKVRDRAELGSRQLNVAVATG